MTQLSINQAFIKAVELHKSGKQEAASRLYVEILKTIPTHPDANHNLGLVLASKSNFKKALVYFLKAKEYNPDVEQYWVSTISTQLQLELYDSAIINMFEALNKGFSNQKLLQLNIKIESFKRLERLGPLEPTAKEISNVKKLAEKNNTEGVSRLYGTLTDKYKHAVNFHIAISRFYLESKMYIEAINAARAAIINQPENAEAYYLIGLCQIRLKQFELGLSYSRYSAKLNANVVNVHNNIGICYYELGEIGKAIDNYLEAKKLDPNDVKTLNNLAIAYSEIGAVTKAHALFSDSLSILKTPKVLHNFGVNLEQMGRQDEAILLYNEAIKLDPANASVHRNLSTIIDYRESCEHLDLMLATIEKLTDPLSKCELQFAIATAYDKLGDYSEAFKYFERSNNQRKRLQRYSFAEDLQTFQTQYRFRLPETLNINPVSTTKEPIFVIGMPRSGTTLIEQILSSHTMVYGAGELPLLNRFGKRYLKDFPNVSLAGLLEVQKAYSKEISNFGDANECYVVDKTPQNFLHLKLILKLFPNGKIIHVLRDPRAVCWSNYTKFFNSGLGYSNDIEDTVNYYLEYKQYMQKIMNEFPNSIINCNYEDLVKDPTVSIKRLLNEVEIPFEETCLSPHLNIRAVKTASMRQIRKPIYTGSSAKWTLYKDLIGNKFDPLNDLI